MTKITLRVMALLLLLFVSLLLAGHVTPPVTAEVLPPVDPPITPRMLVQPGALMGTPPAGFAWHPADALLAYVEQQDGQAARVG